MIKYKVQFRPPLSDEEKVFFEALRDRRFIPLGNGIGSRPLVCVEILSLYRVLESFRADGNEEVIMDDLLFYYRTGEVISGEFEGQNVIRHLYARFLNELKILLDHELGIIYVVDNNGKEVDPCLNFKSQVEDCFQYLFEFNMSLAADCLCTDELQDDIVNKILGFLNDFRDNEMVVMAQSVFFRENKLKFSFDRDSFLLNGRKYYYDCNLKKVSLEQVGKFSGWHKKEIVAVEEKQIVIPQVEGEDHALCWAGFERLEEVKCIFRDSNIQCFDYKFRKEFKGFPKRPILNYLFYRQKPRMIRENCKCSIHDDDSCGIRFYSEEIGVVKDIFRCSLQFSTSNALWWSIYSEIVGNYYIQGTQVYKYEKFNMSEYNDYLSGKRVAYKEEVIQSGDLDHLIYKVGMPRRDILNFLFYRERQRMIKENIKCYIHKSVECGILVSGGKGYEFILPIFRCAKNFPSHRTLWESIYAEIISKYGIEDTEVYIRESFNWRIYEEFVRELHHDKNLVRCQHSRAAKSLKVDLFYKRRYKVINNMYERVARSK